MLTRRLWLPLLVAFGLVGGCAVSGGETDRLPTGVTLLDSSEGECAGPLEFDGEPGVIVDEGEDATIRVSDEDDVAWRCLAGSGREFGVLACPAETRYVRVTREADEADFTLECFGA